MKENTTLLAYILYPSFILCIDSDLKNVFVKAVCGPNRKTWIPTTSFVRWWKQKNCKKFVFTWLFYRPPALSLIKTYESDKRLYSTSSLFSHSSKKRKRKNTRIEHKFFWAKFYISHDNFCWQIIETYAVNCKKHIFRWAVCWPPLLISVKTDYSDPKKFLLKAAWISTTSVLRSWETTPTVFKLVKFVNLF